MDEETVLVSQGKMHVSSTAQASEQALVVAQDKKRQVCCYNCGKRGHLSKECKAPKKDKDSTKNNGKKQADGSDSDRGSESKDQAHVAQATMARMPAF